MKFSEFYDLTLTEEDDWYDIVLSIDVKFFIDPFLIYANEFGPFGGSHSEIINFFNHSFELVAKSDGSRQSYLWKRARNLLLFPEADEFCFGFTASGTKGAGSGAGFSKIIAEALWEAIQSGVRVLTHFEEVGLFREGIGADRISDITATILKHRFATYTENVCRRHDIPVQPRVYLKGYFDQTSKRWSRTEFNLPLNPYSDRPILLAPKTYVRELPTINADDFWDYCYTNENEIIRQDFGEDITKNVNKKTIISFARRHPNLRKDYIETSESEPPDPYDFERDPKGYDHWYDESAYYCKNNPQSLHFETIEAFKETISLLIEEYTNFVENNRGWKLLWHDKVRPRSEEATQLLFLGIVKHYCKANNIDLSKESDIGRGPVDFKVSQGYQYRALLELKLAKNTKFWNGLKRQLPKYLEAEDIKVGYFIVIVYTEKDIRRIAGIREKVGYLNNNAPYDINPIIVDARVDPPSASKL